MSSDTTINNEPEKVRQPYYKGSRHIGTLLNKAIRNQNWKDPYRLPLQNSYWPLTPNELTTLYHIAVGDITLTVCLGHRGKPPVEEYMVLDSKEFPERLKEKLLADDLDGKLDDIASMSITANMMVDGDPCSMTITHKLDDEDDEAWYPPVPLKWNICTVSIECRDDSDSRTFARPGTEASEHYPNIVKDRPLFLNNLTGSELFPDPVLLDYDNDKLTFQYGKKQHTITPDEPFRSDKAGKCCSKSVLTVSLKLVSEF